MGLIAPDFDAFFERSVLVLKDYLGDVVFAGASALALYRAHPRALARPTSVIATKDVDIVTPRSLECGGRPPIKEALEQAGLVLHLRGTDPPPVMKFRDPTSEILELEFLCASKGNNQPSARTIQENLTAQPIRYLDLLFVDSWSIEPADLAKLGVTIPMPVRVPHPVSLVVQKVLNNERKTREGRAKDLRSSYEAVSLFLNELPTLGNHRKSLEATFPKKWFTQFEVALDELFRDEHSKGSTEAARAAPDGNAKLISATMRRLLAAWQASEH